MKEFENSIYIKTLKFGFENQFGVTLKQVIDNADIEDRLSEKNGNLEFKIAFLKWFYTNFNSEKIKTETDIANYITNPYDNYSTIDQTIKSEQGKIAVITGNAVNKYIDYQELLETRISSQTAKRFSYVSVCIALLAIIAPFVISQCFNPPQKVIITNERNEAEYRKFKCPNCSRVSKHKMYKGNSSSKTELNDQNHNDNKFYIKTHNN